ncbi:hypothetical protein BDR04DRAFT_340105 [Suillus decipiens]|nr:hypothetical protein BDR04DRAFT_340105 [Suillus decipiens]
MSACHKRTRLEFEGISICPAKRNFPHVRCETHNLSRSPRILLVKNMRFSFLLAVVAALTTSMSVRGCADQNGLCGSSSPAGDTCCPGLNCKLGPFSGANEVLYCQ